MTHHLLLRVLSGYNVLVIAYFVALNSVYLFTAIFAFRALRRHALRLKSVDVEDVMGTSGELPVTLLAPAYNEEATCVESARSLLTLRHPSYEIIVVNDGSTDGTLTRLSNEFELESAPRAPMSEIATEQVRNVYRSRQHPNLWVVDKENGGKADALNAGLNYCITPLFCAVDADSLLEPDALTKISRPFLEDAATTAVGGVIRIVNGCSVEAGRVTRVGLPRSSLARFQVLEYLRAFLWGRMGWDALGATLIVSGAFGMFRRSSVVEVGGYATDTVGEDMELVVRLHRHLREAGRRYRVVLVPDSVAWTECPETLGSLGRQRDRWQRGLVESLVRHRRMLLNPRYGRIGMLAYPYFFLLEMCGPLIEGVGYVTFALALLLGTASIPFVIAFLAVSFAFGIALSIATVGLEEMVFPRYPRLRDLLSLFWLAVAENIGYRQVITYWRVRGMVSKLRGVTGWGVMERKGFDVANG
jgi:cellulose synthase/poly-beta-1,6-N-acetylglucosamine synthase-like glycosyltransferase